MPTGGVDSRSDAAPGNDEAESWLLGLVKEKDPISGRDFNESYHMLMQRYLLGAPGVERNYQAALDLATRRIDEKWRS